MTVMQPMFLRERIVCIPDFIQIGKFRRRVASMVQRCAFYFQAYLERIVYSGALFLFNFWDFKKDVGFMFNVFMKLGWYFKQEWKRYTIAIAMLLIVNVLEIVPPKLIGMVVDDIHLGVLTWDRLTVYIASGAAIGVSIYLLCYVWHYQLFGSSWLVERILRSKLMGHFLKMTPTFYERNRTGDLMARATNDLSAIAQTAGFGVLTLTDSTTYLVTILTMMAAMISWKLTLAAFLPLPLIALAIKHFGSKIHKRFTEAQDAFGVMNDAEIGRAHV
jgi:ATP-binding cassette, subfamily B, multidrug efflux pump